jgi:hypothetical protein
VPEEEARTRAPAEYAKPVDVTNAFEPVAITSDEVEDAA